MDCKITLIPGDGIGPEIVAEAVKVLNAVADKYGLREGRFAVADYHRRCDDLRSSAPVSLLRIFDIKIKAPDVFPALGALFLSD